MGRLNNGTARHRWRSHRRHSGGLSSQHPQHEEQLRPLAAASCLPGGRDPPAGFQRGKRFRLAAVGIEPDQRKPGGGGRAMLLRDQRFLDLFQLAPLPHAAGIRFQAVSQDLSRLCGRGAPGRGGKLVELRPFDAVVLFPRAGALFPGAVDLHDQLAKLAARGVFRSPVPIYQRRPVDAQGGGDVLLRGAAPGNGCLPSARPWILFSVLYVLAEAFCTWCLAQPTDSTAWRWSQQLPGQLAFFVVGMAGWHYRDLLGATPRRLSWSQCSSTRWLNCSGWGSSAQHRLAGSSCILPLAFVIWATPGVRRLELRRSTFIISRFCTSCFNSACWAWPPGWAGSWALLAIAAAAWLSWFLIEKPFLLGSSHYRHAESTASPASDGECNRSRAAGFAPDRVFAAQQSAAKR